MNETPPRGEWLEADGRGGFASGPVAGPRTRRYHALLLTAQPDGSRLVLVHGADVYVQTPGGTWPLSSQAWAGGSVVHPDGDAFLERFTAEPLPCWTWRLPDQTRLTTELVVLRGHAQVCLRWTVLGGAAARLFVRPFFSGRDYHALHHENPAFRFEPERHERGLVFRPYDGVPATLVSGNGDYRHEPRWYRGFHYAEEARRGLDCAEDLAAPGELTFDLAAGPALLSFSRDRGEPAALVDDVFRAERARRAGFPTPLHRAADAYVIARDDGKTILAGYPWFTDWGRDTFIALRGLCLATGRVADAKAILLRWSGAVAHGMLPNRFPDGGAPPEYNSVDAALWFVVAAYELLTAPTALKAVSALERRELGMAVEAILAGHCAGTRYHIAVTDDGLLAAGEPGVQLTWMDAKVGDWVVTPRIGKPVEVQALWLNALWAGVQLQLPSVQRWRELLARGREAFARRFWNAPARMLYDVVDVDHRAGEVDARVRPNQIFAVGGLPLALLEGEPARAVVDAVERELWTPLGLRSLAPSDAGYRPRYRGGVVERDGAYHEGTVWPWLLGPFVEAWLRVRGNTGAAQREATMRFVVPVLEHLAEAGVGHVSEVADGDAPHDVGGCPFQAWSLGELLRVQQLLRAHALPEKAARAVAGRG
jgi:predicted glycogen debranching enzyme